MDAADSWRAFACTGSIKDYLGVQSGSRTQGLLP